jgi:hypothetical protein
MRLEDSFAAEFGLQLNMGLFGAVGATVITVLFAYGLAWVFRNSAAAIAIYVGVVVMLGDILLLISSLINQDWFSRLVAYLPSNLYTSFMDFPAVKEGGGSLLSAVGESGGGAAQIDTLAQFAPSQGVALGALIAWAVVSLALGACLFKKRDA